MNSFDINELYLNFFFVLLSLWNNESCITQRKCFDTGIFKNYPFVPMNTTHILTKYNVLR